MAFQNPVNKVRKNEINKIFIYEHIQEKSRERGGKWMKGQKGCYHTMHNAKTELSISLKENGTVILNLLQIYYFAFCLLDFYLNFLSKFSKTQENSFIFHSKKVG